MIIPVPIGPEQFPSKIDVETKVFSEVYIVFDFLHNGSLTAYMGEKKDLDLYVNLLNSRFHQRCSYSK